MNVTQRLLMLVLVATVLALSGCEKSPRAPQRKGVALTVYSDDFAQVSEVRPVTLARGDNPVPLDEVSDRLDPQSVLLRWAAGSGPDLVAQTFDAGVSSSADVLRRYRGKQIELVRYNNGSEVERQTGTLISADGPPVVETNGRLYVGAPGTISAPASDDIVTLPRLSVQAHSTGPLRGDLQLTYLTRGLSWSADYVATLSQRTKTISLECWASVVNETGTRYPSANVTLIAGTPNRATRAAAERDSTVSIGLAEPALPGVGGRLYSTRDKAVQYNTVTGGPSAIGELHSYTISSPTTVVPGRTNRLRMFHSVSVPVKLDYAAFLPPLAAYDDFYWNVNSPHEQGAVQFSMTFFNRQADGLGLALPGGGLRVYEPDAAGVPRYTGAATVANTPLDQKVTVGLAQAFDVFTQRRIVRTKRIDKHVVRRTVEVVVHNEKAAPVDVRVVQEIEGLKAIASESHPHAALTDRRVQWTVPVPAGGKTTLTYAVDIAR